MAEPIKRVKAIEDLLEDTTGLISAIRADKCVNCGRDADKFVDRLSKQDYAISGLCQLCQDVIYAEPEEEFED